MSAHNTAQDGPVKPDFRPLYYLRIAKGHQDRYTRPEDVIGYTGRPRGEGAARLEWVHSARPLPGVKRVYAPGEIEEEIRQQRLQEGIEVPESTWQDIAAMAAELGVVMPEV